MHLLPIVTFGLLFIAFTRHLLGKSVDLTDHTSDNIVSSKHDKASIVIETDSLASLASLAKLIVKLDSESQKIR